MIVILKTGSQSWKWHSYSDNQTTNRF